MSKLEELINQYCPDGVKYKTIKNCANVGTGSSDRKDASDDGLYPFYVRSKKVEHKDNYEFDEEAIIIPGEGGIGEIFHYVNGKYALHQRAYRIHFTNKEVDTVFAKYYMESEFKNFITKKAVGATVTSIRKPMIEDFEIPVPPLPVQEEIVRILDKFTELEEELEEELRLRKKQYEYYRDKMLSLSDYDGEVEEVSLGSIARITRGGNFQKKDFVENGKPCIHYGQIYTRYGLSADTSLTSVNEDVWNKSKKAKYGNIVMAVTSENYDDVCKCVVWEGDEDAAISGHTAIIDHDINAHYLAHYFGTSHFYKQKLKLAHGTKVIEVTPDSLNDVVIPIPKDVNEQKRIADILDKFNILISDIAEGLPAEIKMRHQQYEYYRDKLLTFKRLEC